MSRSFIEVSVAAIASALLAQPALAQTALDRVAPATRAPDPIAQPAPAAPTVVLETSAPAAPQVSGTVSAGAISIVGLSVLRVDAFSDILEQYVGRTLDGTDLASLTDRIASRARDRGYVFASARIAPQKLIAGVLSVEVDEGRIDGIEIAGRDNPAVRRALAPLANGQPVSKAALERHLLIADDIDGIQIRGSKLEHKGSRNVLVVTIAEQKITGRVAVRNDGTRPVGPVEIHIDALVSQLLAADDSLAVNYTTAPLEPRELQYARARYLKQIGSDGTQLSLTSSYSAVRPESYLSGYDVLGTSWSGSVGVMRPLSRRRRSGLWLSGTFEVDGLTQSRGGAVVRRDRETVLRLGLYGYTNFLGGQLRANAVVTQGFDLFDATEADDPLASRTDADGTFTAANLWLEWVRPLGGGLSLRLSGAGQLASQPLLLNEVVSLGGGTFLRGYDSSERSGDQGVMGSAELRYDVKRPLGIADRAQLYAFGDGGVVRSIVSDWDGGSLASTGGGVRIDFNKTIGATAEIAVPLTGPRYDTGNRAPRVNLGVSKAF